jgi:hypothetical protein
MIVPVNNIHKRRPHPSALEVSGIETKLLKGPLRSGLLVEWSFASNAGRFGF